MISSEDLMRMRALKANDWSTPLSEKEKDFLERMKIITENAAHLAKAMPREFEVFARWCERMMDEHDKEVRATLEAGTHYILDRVQVHRGMSGEEIDRLLNKRGRRPGEDRQFEERVDGWSSEIVVLRKKEVGDG